MPQSAPMQWFFCFFLFFSFYQVMVSKVWFSSIRPEFFFGAPEGVVKGFWCWGS